VRTIIDQELDPVGNKKARNERQIVSRALSICLRARTYIALALAVGFGGHASASVFTNPSSLQGPDSLITFETGSTALPGIPGLTLTPYGNADSTFSTVLFGNQVYGNASTAQGYTDLYIKFAQPVTEVGACGAAFGFGGPSQLQVNVYGVNTQLLESAVLPLIGIHSNASYVGFFDAGGITEIDWVGGNHGFFAIDNVSYGGPAAVVPEPDVSGLILLTFAAGIVASVRRNEQIKSRAGYVKANRLNT